MRHSTIAFLICLALPGIFSGQTLPELGLFLSFDHPPSPVFVNNMEAELKTILAPVGLNLEWYLPGQNRSPGSWLRTMSFSFHGSCQGYGAGIQKMPLSGGRFPLAETPFINELVFPYSEINCDGVRGFIDEGRQQSPGAEQRLGIAMGRILAHELYHMLLQTGEHSTKGIAEAVYTPAALLAHTLKFEEGELERIISRFSLSSGQRVVGLTKSVVGSRVSRKRTQNTSFRAN